MTVNTAKIVSFDAGQRNAEDFRPFRIACRDSTMLVRIVSYVNRVPCGELLSLSYREKLPFRGLDQLLLIMDDIMDAISVPQAAFEHRSLSGQAHAFEKIDIFAAAWS